MFDLYLQSKIIINYFFLISVSHVEGPILNLHKVSRLDMGAYMCIATNGVPPIISKRIHLNVDCEYDFIDNFARRFLTHFYSRISSPIFI